MCLNSILCEITIQNTWAILFLMLPCSHRPIPHHHGFLLFVEYNRFLEAFVRSCFAASRYP